MRVECRWSYFIAQTVTTKRHASAHLVTPKRRKENLIVRIGLSEAVVTNNKKTALEVLYC